MLLLVDYRENENNSGLGNKMFVSTLISDINQMCDLGKNSFATWTSFLIFKIKVL